MNFFYIDKLIWLMIMILGDIFYIHIIDGLFLAFWIPFFSFLVGFQAKELLLLPLDMICGKKEKTMYFWREVNHIDLDFFPKRKTSVWHFIYSQKGINYKVNLLMPIALEEKQIEYMDRPQIHDKIKVTYYRLSKIICSWERV